MKPLFSLIALVMLIFASLWAIIHPWVSPKLSKTLAKLALILGIAVLLMGWWATPTALGDVHFSKEANQWLYQSKQPLVDTAGHQWDMTALKQMDKGEKGFYLQVMTASPQVRLDAAQSLRLETAAGEQLEALNLTRQLFIGALPASNIAQYDIRSLLPKLKETPSLTLTLPTRGEAEPVTLFIPADVLDEWVSVGSCGFLICTPFDLHA